MEGAFRDGSLRTSGTAITKVLPPVFHSGAVGGNVDKSQRVIVKLRVFVERFFGLSTLGE